MDLPKHIWSKIYSYDSTYRTIYDKVVDEIRLRYDDGKWWIKQTGILVEGSRYSPFEDKWRDRGVCELNFLTRTNHFSLVQQYFFLQDVHNELTSLIPLATSFNHWSK